MGGATQKRKLQHPFFPAFREKCVPGEEEGRRKSPFCSAYKYVKLNVRTNGDNDHLRLFMHESRTSWKIKRTR